MKAFIRKLSINERRGYMHSIIYTMFCGIHILLSKIILSKTNIPFVALLSLSGSLLILMSFYRIFRSIKKYKAVKDKEKLLQIDYLQGIYSFISYSGLMASLNWTSLTNVIFITRLFPFIVMFNTFISYSQSIPAHYIYCFIAYILCFLIIFIPLLSTDQAPGILLCVTSSIFKIISNKYWFQTKGIKVDIIVVSIGFHSACIGGILMVIIYNKMGNISALMWLLIILNAFAAYLMKIFFNKLIKNKTNNQKLLLCNVIILIFALPIDSFLFKVKFSYYYLVLFCLSIDLFFFYKKVIKAKKNNNYLDNY